MKQAASFFASDSGSDSPGPKIGSDIEEKVTEEDKGYDSDDFWVYGKPFLLIYF